MAFSFIAIIPSVCTASLRDFETVGILKKQLASILSDIINN